MIEISVLVLTYNHEKYIRQCLESIVIQKVNVQYEIVIFDDASNDKTVSILKEYKRKYSNIKLYLKKRNSAFPTKNVYFLHSKAKGKYIAWCEGDDYWTDEYKLQKQYDFMENNNKYSACFSDVITVNEIGEKIQNCKIVYNRKSNGVYTLEDYSNLVNPGMTAAYFSRNFFKSSEYKVIYKASRLMGDITLFMLSLMHGKIYQMDEVMAAYRFVEKKGGSSFNSIQRENRYKDYSILKYWCKLEKFIRKNYFSEFCFRPIPSNFYNIAEVMSLGTFLDFLKCTRHKIVYIILFVLKKVCNGSYFGVIDKEKKLLVGKHGSWRKFKMDKKQLIIFGAGTIAKEYLDKYAWKDNILFLTDNNENMHEISYKGYMIKNPKEIKNYKGEIIVLIANNKFENEIAQQLEDMGIDEYYGYYSMMKKRGVNKIAKKLIEITVT